MPYLALASMVSCGDPWPILEFTPSGRAIRKIVYAEDSSVGRVYVVDEGNLRYLRFESPAGNNQSVISLKEPEQVPMEYIRLATVGLAHIEKPRRILMVGLGAGTFTTLLWRILPELQIDVVEISPVIYRIAREYFGLPDDPRYLIHIEDGRRFLSRSEHLYDMIFVDAYNADDTPDHLADEGFFSLVRSHLSSSGIAILNLAVSYRKERKIKRTFASVFPSLVCYRGIESANLVLIGSTHTPVPQEVIHDRANTLTVQLEIPFDLGKITEHRVDCKLKN
jgi:spermidine synthase